MMLTILGLPPTTKYKDLKVLIKTRCNLNDFILDDLMGDNNGLKKVRIGLADANEGAHLMKCLAGYRMAGCVLSVTPVGKTPMPGPGPQQNQNFNQSHNDFRGNDYNDSRPSPWGQQQPHQPQQQWAPNPMGQGPQNNFGYQPQGPSIQNNQYIPPQQHQNQMSHHNQPQNLHPNHQGHLQNHQNMQGPPQMQRPDMKPYPQRDQFQGNRGPQDQGYGFQPKNVMPEPPPQRSHVLRSVEIVDTPMNRPAVQPNRYPGQGYPPQDKPMTIMKDNFQGPSQYNPGQGPASQGPAQPWQQQQQQKPPAFTDPKRPPVKLQDPDRFKDYDKDFEPLSPDREMRKSPFRNVSPGRGSPRRHSPGRRGSPLRRSPGRRMSPSRRSPGRRMSPPGRRSPGRRGSPGPRPLEHDRRSPGRMGPGSPGRSWSGRRPSPGKRSPDRRPDPASLRYSPSRRHAGKPDDFLDRPGSKSVRPAYEPPSQAANQAKYPGGYRPNVHEKVQYPIPGQRPVETRDLPWQQERDKAMFNEVLKKREEERNTRMPFERPGLRSDKDQRSHSPRKSRSPLRRDKSPSRDHYKRHSPSPRSPRRSWALEKRRSPDLGDAPPPPSWPGQATREEKRPDFDDVETKRKPVWEYKKDIIDTRRPDDDRRFPAPEGIRVRRDLVPTAPPERREDLEFKPHDRFQREGPKFSPRDDFDKKVPKFGPRDDFDKKVGPKFSPRDDFENKGPKFSPRDDFEKKGPKFSPRDEFDKKGPKFSPRDDFDKKGPKFSPRDEFEKKGPKFSPRDDFDKRPKFSPREDFIKVPKFSPRDDYQEPKFSRDDLMRKDPKFGHDFERPKFSPRDDYEDRRDEFRKHDLSDWKPREVPLKPPEREVYRSDFPKRDETSRIELRRDVLRKMSEELDKQFEDVHKRAQDFHKRAEEYRRDDRKREFERGPPPPKPYEDRHRDDDERRKEDWNTDEHLKTKAIIIAAIKAKKDKATKEIAQKILDKHNIDAEAPQNIRIYQELRVSVGKIINEMFGDDDVSFIELVIKFNAKYSGAGEDKILRDVMSSFPSQFKLKRSAPEYTEVPAKRSRRTPEPELNKGRRVYSPGARQRPMTTDGYIERRTIPSPVRKPRMETHSYQEPERRPMGKPADRVAPEIKATNAAIIEMKPVLFKSSPGSVSDYPPLPQRNPVQKQPPKPVPQKPEPAKTVPRKPEPVKIVPQKTEPAKTVPQKPEPAKTVPHKVQAAKTVPQIVEPLKTVPQKVETAKTGAQKVEPVKTLPQKIEPVKSAQKPTVVQKQEAKPAQKQLEAQIPKTKSGADKKEVKPAENKTSKPETIPPVEPTPEGYYQLDSPTSHALEDELYQIMAKVSQALPREPASVADRLVVAKIHGVAGDDIKNVLGLNVTKRLLNQHNPLYVKLVFSGKPEAGCLQAFIASRRICAFKRIASPGDTFAARLETMADFDALCQAKEVTCGSAKVTVTPCYKFLVCPSTVKTIYEVTKEEAKAKPDSNNSSPQKQHNVEKSDNSEAKNAELNNKTKPEDDANKDVNETGRNETQDQTKETITETPDKNRKVASNPVKVNITIEAHSKSDEGKNASTEIPKSEAKKETPKPEVNNKVTNQNNELKAKDMKDKSIEEMMVVDEHIDNDEGGMTDHDILALMSGGIVLDECSGSDDEK